MGFDVSCVSVTGLLTLLALPGIGPRRAERIAARFTTLGDVRDAGPNRLKGMVRPGADGELYDKRAWQDAFAHTARVLEDARNHGVRVLAPSDSEYPQWLREIGDRPPVVYLKGKLYSFSGVALLSD